MKLISVKPLINRDKCIGCGICSKVCPAETIRIEAKRAVVNEEFCRGCGACEQRCPVYAITMTRLEKPYTVAVNVEEVPYDEIRKLCKNAHMHPEQIICYCTATRAEEVAAAVLTGSKTPEDISRRTGIRMGCKVECIQPILRLLKAAGIEPERPAGYQWYGATPTLWDISPEIKAKYKRSGFYFDEDKKILEKVIHAKGSRRDSDA